MLANSARVHRKGGLRGQLHFYEWTPRRIVAFHSKWLRFKWNRSNWRPKRHRPIKWPNRATAWRVAASSTIRIKDFCSSLQHCVESGRGDKLARATGANNVTLAKWHGHRPFGRVPTLDVVALLFLHWRYSLLKLESTLAVEPNRVETGPGQSLTPWWKFHNDVSVLLIFRNSNYLKKWATVKITERNLRNLTFATGRSEEFTRIVIVSPRIINVTFLFPSYNKLHVNVANVYKPRNQHKIQIQTYSSLSMFLFIYSLIS